MSSVLFVNKCSLTLEYHTIDFSVGVFLWLTCMVLVMRHKMANFSVVDSN